MHHLKIQQLCFLNHDEVLSVCFSRDGESIAAGFSDGALRVLDSESGGEKCTMMGHTSWVTSVSFSPDSKLVASGSWDMTVRIWDVEKGKEAMAPLKGHTFWVTSVAFSPDSRLVASGSLDMTVRIWDVEKGKEAMAPLMGHTSWVTSVSFSSDSKLVASGSSDMTVRIWDVEKGREAVLPVYLLSLLTDENLAQNKQQQHLEEKASCINSATHDCNSCFKPVSPRRASNTRQEHGGKGHNLSKQQHSQAAASAKEDLTCESVHRVSTSYSGSCVSDLCRQLELCDQQA
jgi:WD40 repeat protein